MKRGENPLGHSTLDLCVHEYTLSFNFIIKVSTSWTDLSGHMVIPKVTLNFNHTWRVVEVLIADAET